MKYRFLEHLLKDKNRVRLANDQVNDTHSTKQNSCIHCIRKHTEQVTFCFAAWLDHCLEQKIIIIIKKSNEFFSGQEVDNMRYLDEGLAVEVMPSLSVNS